MAHLGSKRTTSALKSDLGLDAHSFRSKVDRVDVSS